MSRGPKIEYAVKTEWRPGREIFYPAKDLAEAVETADAFNEAGKATATPVSRVVPAWTPVDPLRDADAPLGQDADTVLAAIRDLVDLGYQVVHEPQTRDGRDDVSLYRDGKPAVDIVDQDSPDAALVAAWREVQR